MGHLQCEVCRFYFYEIYGERGYGFIECHHIIAISKLTEKTTTLVRRKKNRKTLV